MSLSDIQSSHNVITVRETDFFINIDFVALSQRFLP